MSEPEIVAFIPIRFLPSTKNRLARSLDVQQRQDLVESMLFDVLKATSESDLITRTIIVTYDDKFLTSFTRSSFEIYKSSTQGLNEELTECLEHCNQRSSGYSIIILGDLPLLSSKVLDNLIWTGLRTARPVIAKDWKGVGTNILFFKYPRRFQFCFGERSLQEHLREFEAHSLNPIIYYSIETALDIDDISAIEQLMKLAQLDETIQQTKTFAHLELEIKRKGKVA
ncbi:2-phospho-L-lactate guanylyltransferase [Candidatus Bathyarchaeota archaeon]|nr:2-phospho-L-lactate guanylyltransferase [Candidatus Bathyarchaeota archaeon]